MTDSAIADRYARAILELGIETQALASLTDQIRKFAEAYTANRDLRMVLDNPLVDSPSREAILKEVALRLGVSGYALTTLRLLRARHRLTVLPEIARHLTTLTDERAGVLRATVRTAKLMPDAFYNKLKIELESATQRSVTLTREHDPSLIAGTVTQIGGLTIDGSVRGKLNEIQRQLSPLA